LLMTRLAVDQAIVAVVLLEFRGRSYELRPWPVLDQSRKRRLPFPSSFWLKFFVLLSFEFLNSQCRGFEVTPDCPVLAPHSLARSTGARPSLSTLAIPGLRARQYRQKL